MAKVATEEEKAKRVKKEYEILKTKRSHWDSLRQEIADYVLPLREDMQENEPKGKKKGAKTYDGTAVSAVNLAADGIHGNMMSPALKWFQQRLPYKFKFLEKVPEVSLWMQQLTDGLYAAFQNSNFYSEMRMFLRDGLSIGTSVIYPEEDMRRNRICFHTLHPREGFIAENQYREVDKFIRYTKFEARQAVAKFGKENLSQTIRDSLEKNPYAEFDFIHYVSSRDEYDNRKMDRFNMQFESLWVEAKSPDKIVREGGFELFPYMVWRYSLNGNDVYGSSPAAYALPEIKSLNVIAKSMLGAAQLSVEPPMNIPIEMKGRERLVPHGRNYYGNDPNRRIYPTNTGITFPIALDREEKKRDIIKEHFNVNFFLTLMQDNRVKTATEVAEMKGEQATILGAAIGDLTTVMDNIIDYVAYLEMKAGRIPPPPDILIQYAGGEKIDTVYTGTLAQAQRRLLETQSITHSLEITMPLIQVFPEAADIINADDSVISILRSNGYPEELINSVEKVAEIRKSRAEGQAKAMQQADLDRLSDVIKKLAQADKHTAGKLSEMLNKVIADAGMGGTSAPLAQVGALQ